jgi:hypothetical protein
MSTLLLTLALAQSERILEEYRKAKPTDAELSFYQHDWAPDLASAKVRAAKEGRPVFLLYVTNISGPDDVFTGHC